MITRFRQLPNQKLLPFVTTLIYLKLYYRATDFMKRDTHQHFKVIKIQPIRLNNFLYYVKYLCLVILQEAIEI